MLGARAVGRGRSRDGREESNGDILAVGRKGKKNKYESDNAKMKNPSFHHKLLLSSLKKPESLFITKERKNQLENESSRMVLWLPLDDFM